MSFRRASLLFLFILLLFASLAWLAAPLWLSKGAEHILARQLCSDVVVDVDEVGWNKSHIKRLYCKDQKNTFEVDLSDAALSYTMSELIEQRIEHLRLESVVIQLRPSSASKSDVAPILTTPALLLEALPISSFHIRHIDLQRQNSEGSVQQELKGHAEYSDQGLLLMLSEDAYLKGLQLKLEADKKNGVSAELYRGKASILKMESTVHKTDNGLSIDGTTNIELALLAPVLKPWMNMPGWHWAGNIRGSWRVSFPAKRNKPLLQQLDMSAALKLDVAVNRPDSGVGRGKARLKLKLKQGIGTWEIDKGSQIKFGAKEKMSVHVSGLSGTFARSETGWRGSVAAHSELQFKNMVIDNMRMSHVHIRTGTPVEIVASPKGGLKLVKTAAVTATFPTLQWQGNSLSSRHLKLTMLPGSILSPTGRFAVRGIGFTSATLRFPNSSISGTYAVTSRQVSARGDLSAQGDRIHLGWTLNHQLAQAKGVLDFSSRPVSFGANGIDLSRIIKRNGDYAIDNGSLAINGRLKWQKGKKTPGLRLRAACDLELSNLKGHYKTNVFSGFGGRLLLSGDENKLVMAPSTVTLDSLQAGLPLTHISMHTAFTYPFAGLALVEINQLKADALGGQITSDKITIDLARASNPFLVQLNHIDAARLVALRGQEGLDIQGLLDGNLPFNWTRDGLKMTSGVLKSPTGGLIRYLGTESVRKLATTDQATRMVLDILNNFHYKQLNIGANYLPDGKLKMSIKLKGKNPEYEQGRPIAFNFNIEENVLKLLQALNMAGGISSAVEKKVQKKLHKQ